MRPALPIEKLKSVYGLIAKRYDLQHTLITSGTDQKGRKLLVEKAISEGNRILDCGSGTGKTGIMAAKKAGPDGRVILFDLSDDMLEVARQKVIQEGLQDRVEFRSGDLVHLPFEADSFDVVVSTYSLCPVYDPQKGARELYRVTRPGGKLAVAHSTEPSHPVVRWLADRIEDFAWHFSWLSMGCRSVSVLPVLQEEGAKLIFSQKIGVPLWPFLVFIVEKPDIGRKL